MPTTIDKNKIYRLTDGENEVFTIGYLSNSEDVSSLVCQSAARAMAELEAKSVDAVRDLLNARDVSYTSKRPDLDADVDRVFGHAKRNIAKATTIVVDRIEVRDDAVVVRDAKMGMESWAVPFHYPAHDESMLERDRKCLAFLEGRRSIEEAVELAKIDDKLPVLFANRDLTEKQLATLAANTSEQSWNWILQRTERRLTDHRTAYELLRDVAAGSDLTDPTDLPVRVAQFVDYSVRSDPSFIKSVVSLPDCGCYALATVCPNSMRADPEIVIPALKNGLPFHAVMPSLKQNDDFVLRAAYEVPADRLKGVGKSHLSEKLQAEIGEHDPSIYLRAKALRMKLDSQLPNNEGKQVRRVGLKI
ncbi:hypothetical protein AWB71_01324 [Caballeronia peredens]|nr:hypothetical protein AWB71_01324 [Caballeronia peredens]